MWVVDLKLVLMTNCAQCSPTFRLPSRNFMRVCSFIYVPYIRRAQHLPLFSQLTTLTIVT